MRYFNESDVRRYDETIILNEHTFSEKSGGRSVDVFLSHSSNDKADLPATINFLESYGVNVYIDKKDNKLPKKTSKDTGEILKRRIDESKKFIVLVSENSKNSRWIPWELGIADEKKKIHNIALLPKVEGNENPEWPEQEYLGLYPRIVYAVFKGQDRPVWMVYNHYDNIGIELGEWLKRRV